MEGGGGGGGGSSSCLMSYGEHNNNNSSHNNNNNNNIGSVLSSCVAYNNNNLIFSDHNNNNNCTASGMMFEDNSNNNNNNNININNNEGGGGLGFMMTTSSSSSSSCFKAKIMSHPHYPRLLSAYLNCQKIGAPPEVVERLEEACRASVMSTRTSGGGVGGGGSVNMAQQQQQMMMIGQDPALDQFMEAYCEMLVKYEQELSKPFKEAMLFLSTIESQFKSISISTSDSAAAAAGGGGDQMDRNGSSEEEREVDHVINNNNNQLIAEDRELKGQLLRKYSGYLGSLKQEFMKKRKKGKLPKEARQQLLDWWARHYKWPYPSEAQKLALAESTGLDAKQINNWFINQRKRHWKPSEDMQFVVMDAAHHPHYFMDNILSNPYPAMDVSLL